MRKGRRELAGEIGHAARRIAGLLRRVAVDPKGTAATLWRLFGNRDEVGDEETIEAEVFGGIGIVARPAESSSPEAIVVSITSANHPVIVAVRDQQATQAAVDVMTLGPDETMMFNGGLAVKLTAGGELLAGAQGGPYKAVALADHDHSLPALATTDPIPVPVVVVAGPPIGNVGASSSNSVNLKVT